MKRILTILALTLYLCTAWAQNKVFQKYADIDNIEYICITKSMLKLLPTKSANINGVSISGITDAINTILIINSQNEKVTRQMKDDFATLRQDPDYEVLMETRNDNERVTTLLNPSLNKDVKELVMYISHANKEQTFIVLTGTFSDQQIKDIVGG